MHRIILTNHRPKYKGSTDTTILNFASKENIRSLAYNWPQITTIAQ